jgi:hypothetical protein
MRTTRYKLLTFIPLTLLENFRLATNVYFLIILFISCLPFSPVSYLFDLLLLVFLIILIISSRSWLSSWFCRWWIAYTRRMETFRTSRWPYRVTQTLFDRVHVILRAVLVLDSDLVDGHDRDHTPLPHLHNLLRPAACLEELFSLWSRRLRFPSPIISLNQWTRFSRPGRCRWFTCSQTQGQSNWPARRR